MFRKLSPKAYIHEPSSVASEQIFNLRLPVARDADAANLPPCSLFPSLSLCSVASPSTFLPLYSLSTTKGRGVRPKRRYTDLTQFQHTVLPAEQSVTRAVGWESLRWRSQEVSQSTDDPGKGEVPYGTDSQAFPERLTRLTGVLKVGVLIS